MITLRFDYIRTNARQRFHNNINVNRKCTRRGLWDRYIWDYAAIWCVLGRSFRDLLSIQTGYANVKSTASLLNEIYNAPIDEHLFQNQRTVFYAVKLSKFTKIK